MKKRTCFGLFLALLFLLCIPLQTVQAKDTSVEDCIEGKGDCAEADTKTPSKKDNRATDQKSETKNEEAPVADADTFSPGASLAKMVLALALILVLIYGVLKFLSSRTKSFQQNRIMQNLGGISVGQNKSVQLVRIGDKLYMLGVGDNVELLEEITDEQTKRQMIQEEKVLADSRLNNPLSNIFSTETAGNSGIKKLFTKELDKLKANRSRLIRKREEEEERHE